MGLRGGRTRSPANAGRSPDSRASKRAGKETDGRTSLLIQLEAEVHRNMTGESRGGRRQRRIAAAAAGGRRGLCGVAESPRVGDEAKKGELRGQSRRTRPGSSDVPGVGDQRDGPRSGAQRRLRYFWESPPPQGFNAEPCAGKISADERWPALPSGRDGRAQATAPTNCDPQHGTAAHHHAPRPPRPQQTISTERGALPPVRGRRLVGGSPRTAGRATRRRRGGRSAPERRGRRGGVRGCRCGGDWGDGTRTVQRAGRRVVVAPSRRQKRGAA